MVAAIIGSAAFVLAGALCWLWAKSNDSDRDLCPECQLHLRHIDVETGFALPKCYGCAIADWKRYA